MKDDLQKRFKEGEWRKNNQKDRDIKKNKKNFIEYNMNCLKKDSQNLNPSHKVKMKTINQ